MEEPGQPGWWGRQGCIVKAIVVLVVIGVIGAIIGAGKDDGAKTTATTRYTAATTTTANASTNAGLYIVEDSLKVSHNSIGYLVLEGKVGNQGARPLEFVKLQAYALDASKATVNTEFGYIDSDILAPGATSTFKLFVEDPNDEATSGRVIIESADFAD